jgi:hypothetical protein
MPRSIIDMDATVVEHQEVAKIVASVSRYPAGQAVGDGVDSAETLMQLALDRHFNGGKHLMLSVEGRFWHYDGRLWRDVPDQSKY